MEFSIKSGSPEKQRAGCMVVGVLEGRKLTASCQAIDAASRHGVSEVLRKGDPSSAGAHEQMYGVYATGWIKRGPVGLIGHTKSDAMETVRHLINDLGNWWAPESPSEESVTAMLDERGIAYTNLDGWHNLDQHELALGEAEGRTRIKVVPREEMVSVSRQE